MVQALTARELSEQSLQNIKDAYAKWPMGNEGFVTSSLPDSAIAMIKEHYLEAKVVGRLEKRNDGVTGVKLRAFNGDIVDFTKIDA